MTLALVVLGVAFLTLLYVLVSFYRGVCKVLDDPDTWKLLDGE